MRNIGSITRVGTTVRLILGPFSKGTLVKNVGIFAGAASPHAETSVTVGINLFSDKPPDTLDGFASGQPMIVEGLDVSGTPSVRLPYSTQNLLPVNYLVDRYPYIGMQVFAGVATADVCMVVEVLQPQTL